jgi:hypothetical protein
MTDEPTCGQGLARHAALTASLGELIASTARVLEVHMRALDLTDDASKREHDAYRELATAHRRIAIELADTAHRMEGYRTLPMGRHDMVQMMSPAPRHAFAGFVNHELALASLLEARLAQDRAMLEAMSSASQGD